MDDTSLFVGSHNSVVITLVVATALRSSLLSGQRQSRIQNLREFQSKWGWFRDLNFSWEILPSINKMARVFDSSSLKFESIVFVRLAWTTEFDSNLSSFHRHSRWNKLNQRESLDSLNQISEWLKWKQNSRYGLRFHVGAEFPQCCRHQLNSPSKTVLGCGNVFLFLQSRRCNIISETNISGALPATSAMV